MTENKRTRIALAYPETNEIPEAVWLGFDRVSLVPEYAKYLDINKHDDGRYNSSTLAPQELRRVVMNVLALRPKWEAVINSRSSVHIKQDGHDIGVLSRWYSRRSDAYGVVIEPVGGETSKSADLRTAVRKTLDTFRARTPQQIYAAGFKAARDFTYGAAYKASQQTQVQTRTLQDKALAFALSPAGRAAFAAYLGDDELLKDYEGKYKAEAQAKDLHARITNGKDGVLCAVADGSGYWVQQNGLTVFWEAGSLPAEYAHLDALRMMPVGTVLDEMGVRVAEASYIVFANQQEEP